MITPKNKYAILSQPIWNNKFSTVNKKMVCFPHWYQVGIRLGPFLTPMKAISFRLIPFALNSM